MDKYSEDYDRRSRKRRAGKKRRKKSIVVLIIMISILVGSVPASAILFDRILDSNANVDVISELIAKIIPDSLITSITSRFSGSDTSADTSSSLNADALENADITDPNVLAETTPVSDSYFDETLIFSDAIYNTFIDEELVPADNVFTIKDFTSNALTVASFTDNTNGVSGTIDQIVATRAPKQIYIFPGLTDTEADQNDAYIQSFGSLIDKIQSAAPDVSIVICSIAPVGKSYSGSVTNDRIRTLNGNILSLVREKSIYYLNTFTTLSNERGILSDEYDDGNGKLNTDAGKKIINILKNHAVPS